jgi:hypothetical protein
LEYNIQQAYSGAVKNHHLLPTTKLYHLMGSLFTPLTREGAIYDVVKGKESVVRINSRCSKRSRESVARLDWGKGIIKKDFTHPPEMTGRTFPLGILLHGIIIPFGRFRYLPLDVRRLYHRLAGH